MKYLLGLLMVIATQVKAQQTVQLTLHGMTNNYLKDFFISGLNFFGESPKTDVYMHAIFLTCKGDVKNKIHAGFSLGHEIISNKLQYETGYTSSFRLESLNAAIELYSNFRKISSKCRIYGFLGVGLNSVTITNTEVRNVTTEKRLKANWHVTFFAMDFPLYKKWNGVVELGVGYKGLIGIGVKYAYN